VSKAGGVERSRSFTTPRSILTILMKYWVNLEIAGRAAESPRGIQRPGRGSGARARGGSSDQASRVGATCRCLKGRNGASPGGGKHISVQGIARRIHGCKRVWVTTTEALGLLRPPSPSCSNRASGKRQTKRDQRNTTAPKPN